MAGIAAEADPPTQKKQGEDDTCAKMATHRDECMYDASAQYERMWHHLPCSTDTDKYAPHSSAISSHTYWVPVHFPRPPYQEAGVQYK